MSAPKGSSTTRTSLSAYAYDAFVVESTPELVLLPEFHGCGVGCHGRCPPGRHSRYGPGRRNQPLRSAGANEKRHCALPDPAGTGFSRSTPGTATASSSRGWSMAISRRGLPLRAFSILRTPAATWFPPSAATWPRTPAARGASNTVSPWTMSSSLEVVLADGEVIRFGSRNVKDVTGYRLSGLFCGSEGTLGIVTEITLRVVPPARGRADDGPRRVLRPGRHGGHRFRTLSDRASSRPPWNSWTRPWSTRWRIRPPSGCPRDAAGVLLIEVDGVEEAVEKQMRLIVEKAGACGAREVVEARTPAERENLWTARRSIYGVFARLAPDCIVEDATRGR